MTRYSDRLLEWMFAMMMTTWGLWLLAPGDTFANPVYLPLASLAGESVWGVWSVAIGIIRMVALTVNGVWSRTPLIRVACSILGMIWWVTLIYLYTITPPQHPTAGLSWYPVFVIFEGVACWRAAADGFHSRAFGARRHAGPRRYA